MFLFNSKQFGHALAMCSFWNCRWPLIVCRVASNCLSPGGLPLIWDHTHKIPRFLLCIESHQGTKWQALRPTPRSSWANLERIPRTACPCKWNTLVYAPIVLLTGWPVPSVWYVHRKFAIGTFQMKLIWPLAICHWPFAPYAGHSCEACRTMLIAQTLRQTLTCHNLLIAQTLRCKIAQTLACPQWCTFTQFTARPSSNCVVDLDVYSRPRAGMSPSQQWVVANCLGCRNTYSHSSQIDLYWRFSQWL